MTTLLAPIDLSAATQTGPKVYRKQVLKRGRINYKGRMVEFSDEYLTDLAASFNSGAYDHVPFILADADNRHNEDPRNFAGTVKALEVTPDGLDAVIELSDEAAELVQRTGGRLGVSARIKESLEHVDGRRFGRVVRHVLGTLDPRMTGMRPWEPAMDLSTDDDDELLDLSRHTYQGDNMRRRIDASRLSDEDMEALESFAIVNGIDLSVEADDDDTDDEPDLEPDTQYDGTENDEPADEDEDRAEVRPLSDAELDALLDAEVSRVNAEDDARELEPVSLSDDEVDDVLDLAAGMVADNEDETQVLRRDAAAARFDLARETYGQAGVPPYVLDLARPILELSDDSDVLELSSPATGDAIDVRGIVTGLLDAFRGTVDLSAEAGHAHEDVTEQQEQDTAARWTDYLNNN